MFTGKNLSPGQLSFFTALILSIPISLLIFIIENSWIWGLASFIIILAGSYLLVLFVLQRFIYRKIKLIYKFIYQTKATRQEEIYNKYLLPQKSIDEVREDVEAWAARRNEEIKVLRENERFRKEFLQNISHEFKTPVFAIQAYVESLQDNGIADPEILNRFLKNTAKNVERLTNLILDLDEISKLESGELKLNKKHFIIQDLVREVFESFMIIAEEKKIRFSIKKGCEAPLSVYADQEKIRQVLTNLTENSIKYGKQGMEITASMYKTDESRILVEISDEGTGIPERHIPRIFERFYRTESGRSMDITGSGLGLAICKHIVEAHGQTIHLRSTDGIGTTVGFTLDESRNQ